MIFWFLFIFLLILLFIAMPVWPYSREWGYYPGAGLALLLLLLVLWWFALLPVWIYPTPAYSAGLNHGRSLTE